VISSEVAWLLESVPEFVDRFLELVEDCDSDPGAAAAFTELADFVSGLLANSWGRSSPCAPARRSTLRRCLEGVEEVARRSPDAEEIVGWGFLDCICPEDLERVLVEEGLSPTSWTNGPHYHYTSHSHPYEKVLYCVTGSITFHTDEGDATLGPGDRLELESGLRHRGAVGPRGVRCVEAPRNPGPNPRSTAKSSV